LITLALRPYDFFEISTTYEKSESLGYTFSNLELEVRKLGFSLRKDFNLFANLANCQEWLPTLDILRTEYCKDIVFMFSRIPALAERRL
jgi:hypothetical protein